MIISILICNALFNGFGDADAIAADRFSLEAFGGQLYINQPTLQFAITYLPKTLWFGGGQISYHIRNSPFAVFLSGKYGYTKNLGCFSFELPHPVLKYSSLYFSSGVGYENKLVNDLTYFLGPAISGFYTAFFYHDTTSNPTGVDTTLYNFYLYPTVNLGLRLKVLSFLFIRFQAEVGYIKVLRWGSPGSDVTVNARNNIIPDLRLGLGCFIK